MTLAQALHEREESAAALRVAEHGLSLEGPKGALAAWISDLAVSLGDVTTTATMKDVFAKALRLLRTRFT